MTDNPKLTTAEEIAAFVRAHPINTFGGMGGIKDGRDLDMDDDFEMAVERQLGKDIRDDNAVATEMWCAISNMDWQHTNGDTAGYSFRAAGDLVAAIRGSGNYMDWYCSGPDGVVSDRIADAMAKEGWKPIEAEQPKGIPASELMDKLKAAIDASDNSVIVVDVNGGAK